MMRSFQSLFVVVHASCRRHGGGLELDPTGDEVDRKKKNRVTP
tara:strand:+ start:757 stop:885 length:129 start_codon:yes stop_codon:yes gene_type:complete